MNQSGRLFLKGILGVLLALGGGCAPDAEILRSSGSALPDYASLERGLVAAAEGRLELLIRYQDLESRFSPVSGLFHAEPLPQKVGDPVRQRVRVEASASQTRLRVGRVLSIQLQDRPGYPCRGEVEAVLEIHGKFAVVEIDVAGEPGNWWGPQPFRITDRLSLWSDRPLAESPVAVQEAWERAEASLAFSEPRLQLLWFRIGFEYETATRSWRVDPDRDEVARELEPHLRLANLHELERAAQQAQGPDTGRWLDR